MTRALAFLLALTTAAYSHDSWISKGGLKNGAGEWCCGQGDCALMDPKAVTSTSRGYHFNGIGRISSGAGEIAERYNEMVPQAEMQPSPDGAYWRCKRPDGSRRCVFGPPPGS